MRFVLLFIIGCAACGGQVAIESDASTLDASSVVDAKSDAAKDAGVDAPAPTCNERIAAMNKLHAAATECTEGPNACQDLISAVCCKMPVTDASSPAAKAWLDALVAASKADCLPKSCPLCPMPKMKCVNGHCG